MSVITPHHWPPYLVKIRELAKLGGLNTLPNPQVGAVIVHQDSIIGEGYHPYVGGPHAEVVAVNSVKDKSLLPRSSIFVTLEPCSYQGRTPACTDLILREKIPHVVVGCLDPNPRVAGQGVQRLRAAGVQVDLVPDPSPFEELVRVFYVNQQLKRPYLSLKWAESSDGYIAGLDKQGQARQVAITQAEANVQVHQLRAEHQAILVGRRTAAIDNPRLTTRHVDGPNPLRIVFDRKRRLSPELHLFTDQHPSLVLSDYPGENTEKLGFYQPRQWQDLTTLFAELYAELEICSILVEGGSNLMQQCLDQDCFDEVHRFTGHTSLGQGLRAPTLPTGLRFPPASLLGSDHWERVQVRRFRRVEGSASL